MYDAYVVYQTQKMDKGTEDKLSRFVTQVLPAVLEDKCGYRLFIHGRDDIPGEGLFTDFPLMSSPFAFTLLCIFGFKQT